MNKIVHIEGMMCEHCVANVTKGLKTICPDVKVSLKSKKATLPDCKVADKTIKDIVEDLGYEVVGIDHE